jgi:hypothetical protein
METARNKTPALLHLEAMECSYRSLILQFSHRLEEKSVTSNQSFPGSLP